MKILTCQQMRELEERAVQSGIPYETLMDRAGGAVVGYLREHYPTIEQNIVVLCGKGNNGGDGFVIAERLCDLCNSMTVLLVDGLPTTELAKQKLRSLRETGTKIYLMGEDLSFAIQQIGTADLLVDAIYGIGFHGTIREALVPLFDAVNQSGMPVIAVDIPSGLNGDSHQICGPFLQATATITFTTRKPVHLFEPTKSACGTIQVAEVGIGKNCIREQPFDCFVPDAAWGQSYLKKRNPNTHKGSYGRLLAVCGSEGMAGAAILSASAAVCAGTGIVDVALPRSIYPIVSSRVVEPVYTVWREEALEEAQEQVLQKLERASACLIGCGLGEGEGAKLLVSTVLRQAKVPVILDADGINIVAQHRNSLKTVSAPLILTPHPGEMARLLGCTVPEVEKNRLPIAREFAKAYAVTLVLKGHHTLVVSPEGTVAYNETGNAGMAKGGSGDVLAGLIAGFCAQGMPPFTAASLGVYLHGLAGDSCAARYSQRGMLPSQMIPQLQELFLNFENAQGK